MNTSTEKKYSPLTQYMYWLKGNQQFPEDANALYIGTLLNLTEDDFSSCIYLDSLINNDIATFYNIRPEMFGCLHKRMMTKNNPAYIKSTRPNTQILKAIRKKYPHLKLSDIELFLSTIEDKDGFLESLGLKDTKIVKLEKSFALLYSILEESFKNINDYDKEYYTTNVDNIEDVKILFLGDTPSKIIPKTDIPYISTYLCMWSVINVTNRDIQQCFDAFNTIRTMIDKKAIIVPYTANAVKRLGIDLSNAYKSVFKFESNTVVPIKSIDDVDRMDLVKDIVLGNYTPRVKKADKKTVKDAVQYYESLNEDIDISTIDINEVFASSKLDATLENKLNDFMQNVDKPKTEVKHAEPKVNQPEKESAGLMLVDTIYKVNKEEGDKAFHIFRQNDKKIIQEIDTFIDVYTSNKETDKSVMPINKLQKHKIKYQNRWFFMKDNPISYGADLSFAVHKNVEWRSSHEETQYKLRIAIIDIELYTGDSLIDFSQLPTEASKFPINLITVYDNYTNKCYTFIYNLNKSIIDKEAIKNNLEYDLQDFELHEYTDERLMLIDFLNLFNTLEVDLCSGWNTDQFDLPYIYYRCNALNVDINWNRRHFTKNDKDFVDIEIPFVHTIDYLRLYKEMSFGERESFKLGFIANHELGIDKVDLDANMTQVFDEDIDKFIAYNINDVYLVKLIDDKLKYIDLMKGIVQITNIGWKEGYTTLRLMDGLIYSYLYNKGMTFITRKENQDKETLQGAYVRKPNKGIYEWVCDFDLASLYPYITARYNLFPDTYVGKIDEDLMYEFMYHRDRFLNRKEILVSLHTGNILKTSTHKFEKWITNKHYIVTVAGTIFKSHEEELSILYEIIDMMIKERKKYKDMMFEAVKNKEEMLVDRYNNIQTTYKVLTNSLYGAMANAGFRFFSNEVTQTITKTGREISKLGSYMVNEYLKKMETEKAIDVDFIDIDRDFLVKAEGVLDTIIYGDSVVGDTKIYIDNECKDIQDVWHEEQNKQNITFDNSEKQRLFFSKPTYTATIDKNNNVVNAEIEYIMRHKTSKQLYKITTANGKCIYVTEDESVMVLNDKQELVECKPKDILPGTTLLSVLYKNK